MENVSRAGHRAACAMLYDAVLLANSHISWLCDQLDTFDNSAFVIRKLSRVIDEMRESILTPSEDSVFDIAGLREQADRADILRLSEALEQAQAHIGQLWDTLESECNLRRAGSNVIRHKIAHAIDYAHAILTSE